MRTGAKERTAETGGTSLYSFGVTPETVRLEGRFLSEGSRVQLSHTDALPLRLAGSEISKRSKYYNETSRGTRAKG